MKNINITLDKEDEVRLEELKKALRTKNSCYAVRWMLAEVTEKILPKTVTSVTSPASSANP